MLKLKFKDSVPELAGVTFDIGFLRDGQAYTLNRNTKTLTKKLLDQIREQGGVRVYFEGFRVYPYGEKGDDWLNLDRDYARRKISFGDETYAPLAEKLGLNARDVGLLAPRNANVLGRVYLNQASASHMTTKMSREGFTDSQALKSLIATLRSAIEWATVHYAYAKNKHENLQRREYEKQFIQSLGTPQIDTEDHDQEQPLKTAMEFLVKSASSALPTDKTTPEEQNEKISLAQSVIASNLDSKEREISRLRTLASTAPLLFTFTHEVYSLIGQLDTHANTLRQIAKKPLPKEDRRNILYSAAEDLKSTGQNFRAVASLFGVLTTTKDSDQKRHYVKPLLEGLIQGTQFALDESAIHVDLVCDQDVKTPKMKKAEFVSIVVNLYMNSLKSTMAAKGKKIAIRCLTQGSLFLIEVLDQGVGLSKKYRQEVFEPFVSDPEQKIYSRLTPGGAIGGLTGIGQGSGLGLSIIEGLTSNQKGSVEFFDEKGWKLGVRAIIPRG